MKKIFFPALSVVVAASIVGLPGDVLAQTRSTSSVPDNFDAAVALIRATQSRYIWCSFVADIDDHLDDRDGKTYASHRKLTAKLAGDAFAFEIDRDLLKASKESEAIDVPLIRVTFDGRVQANLEIPRIGDHPATLGYHPKDASFADYYGFWPIFGFFDFSSSQSLADLLEACRRKDPSKSLATLSSDGKAMHVTGQFATINLMVDLNLEGTPVISNVKLSLPQDITNYSCNAWGISNGIRVPQEVIVTRESTDRKEKAKVVVKFSKFDVFDPSSISVKELTWIPEAPGTIVIDAFKKWSYTWSKDGSFRWLPFFDPVTGDTNFGPDPQKK